MTPAILLLEKQGVDFQVHSYAHNPAVTAFGTEAAQQLGVAPTQIYKTLVVKGATGKLAVALVPVSAQLVLKALANALGTKKVTMADSASVTRSTGYQLGGVSPLAQKQKLETVIDASAFQFATIFVSAGKRGLEIELSPHDLQELSAATIAAIAST